MHAQHKTTTLSILGILYKLTDHSTGKLITLKKHLWQNLLLLTLQNSGDAEYIIPC